MKSGKIETAEGTALPNQESIRIPLDKENFKYLGLIETYRIKTEMKIKISSWEERENFTKASSEAKIYSKE